MNFRKKLVLSLALISTAGLTQTMARTDPQILESVDRITYANYGTMERYIGILPDGTQVGFLRILGEAGSDEIVLAVADYARDNFLTPQAQRDAFNYLRDKYNLQQQSSKLTQ